MKGILASVFEIPASIRNTSTVPDVLPVLKTVLDISGKNNASNAVHISAFSEVQQYIDFVHQSKGPKLSLQIFKTRVVL